MALPTYQEFITLKGPMSIRVRGMSCLIILPSASRVPFPKQFGGSQRVESKELSA